MKLFLLILLVVAGNSLAQLFLKIAAVSSGVLHTCFFFGLTMLCLGFSFICWFIALRHKPLAFLHPFAALIYVFVPAEAALFLGESINLFYVCGIICILAGICFTSVSVQTSGAETVKKSC